MALSDGTMRTVALDLQRRRFRALRTFTFHQRCVWQGPWSGGSTSCQWVVFFFFFFFSADRALFTAASCLPCSRCVLQVQTIAGGAPSSLVLSSATDGRVALWDWRDGDNAVPVLSLALHQSGINGLAARVVDSAPGREGGGRGRGEQDSKCRWM